MATEVIYDRQDEVKAFALEKIGLPGFREDAVAIGLARDGEIIAACVFECFSQCDCSVHLASDGSRRWCNREYIVRCMAYPFLQLNLRRITGLVPARNKAALNFDLAFGFKQEGYIRHGMPDDDLVLLGMLREECRWLPQVYNPKRHIEDAA